MALVVTSPALPHVKTMSAGDWAARPPGTAPYAALAAAINAFRVAVVALQGAQHFLFRCIVLGSLVRASSSPPRLPIFNLS